MSIIAPLGKKTKNIYVKHNGKMKPVLSAWSKGKKFFEMVNPFNLFKIYSSMFIHTENETEGKASFKIYTDKVKNISLNAGDNFFAIRQRKYDLDTFDENITFTLIGNKNGYNYNLKIWNLQGNGTATVSANLLEEDLENINFKDYDYIEFKTNNAPDNYDIWWSLSLIAKNKLAEKIKIGHQIKGNGCTNDNISSQSCVIIYNDAKQQTLTMEGYVHGTNTVAQNSFNENNCKAFDENNSIIFGTIEEDFDENEGYIESRFEALKSSTISYIDGTQTIIYG